MSLTKQPLPLQFAGGIESRQDAKQVPATKLLALENATFIKQTTLAKRNGYRELSRIVDGAGAEYTTAVGLANRGDELLLFTGERALSYRPSVDRWSDTGEVVSVVATHRPVARTGTAQTMPDHATNGGVTVVAWEDSRGGLRCSVLESDSGRSLLADVLLDANGSRPRCVPCGSMLHVYWMQASSQRICVAVINPALPASTPTPIILLEDLSTTSPAFDACPVAAAVLADQPAIMSWRTALGFRVAYVMPSGVLGSSVLGVPGPADYAATSAVGIAISIESVAGAKFAVAYANVLGQAVVYIGDATNLASATPGIPATPGIGVRAACAWDDDRRLWWAVETVGADAVSRGAVDITGATVAVAATLRGHGIVSRAFSDGGHVYVAVVHAPKLFTYTAVVRLSGDTFGSAGTIVAASLLPTETPGLPPHEHVSAVYPIEPDASLTSRRHALALSYRIQLDDEDGDGIDEFSEEGIRLTSLDFDHDDSYQTAEHGRGLYLASACLQHYDGARWSEAGFLTNPDSAADIVGASASGMGSIAAGTYLYAACYEDIDANGELHQGGTGAPIIVVVTDPSSSVTIAIPTCRLTNRTNVRIGIYRTAANQTGDDIPYYRVTSVDPNNAAGNNRYVANDPTVDTVTFTDALADADLLEREPLYTNGGILSNDPAPCAGNVLAGGKSRLFWTDQADPQLVRYSKPRADDTALEAVSSFALQCDPFGGAITALAVLDDAVIIGKATALHLFAGAGPLADPDVDPSTNSFSPTALLTSDVGVSSPSSLGQLPNGIMLQSTKGIMLLGRDRQIQRIGTAVDAYNDQRIARTTLLPDRPQALLLTDEGLSLLYDYERGQWSTFTNHTGCGACVVGGAYHYLRTDGRVFVETPAEYKDGNSHIRLRIETAWIKATGYLQGWQRYFFAYFLGAWKSSHTLRVRYRLDYEDAWSEPFDLDVNENYEPDNFGAGAYGAGAYGGDADTSTVYQRSLHLNQRCQAIQFRVEDVEPTDSYGASFELSELLLTGGILGSAFRPGEARST
jgi:hypothetical protein